HLTFRLTYVSYCLTTGHDPVVPRQGFTTVLRNREPSRTERSGSQTGRPHPAGSRSCCSAQRHGLARVPLPSPQRRPEGTAIPFGSPAIGASPSDGSGTTRPT